MMDGVPPPSREALDLPVLTERAKAAGVVLKALSHESRFLLLCMMADGERCVGELGSLLDLRQSAVSQQLARLRLDGMVKPRRDGKTIFYSIADENVRRIVVILYDVYCRQPRNPDLAS
ncbi:MAG: ArsR/SmtB family transcription factor [Beijerinckiaceae bacterium]